MGLPEININFLAKANTFVKRSSRGTVAILLKDATVTGLHLYKDSIPETDKYSEENLKLINTALSYKPYRLYVGCVSATDGTVSDALALIKDKRINYLSVPFASSSDTESIKTFIEAQRKRKIMIKAVLANVAADSENIINFTTTGIKKGTTTVSTGNFTVELACVFATLPLTQSSTYYVFPEVTEITSKADENASIDDGELILINDGEKIKIGRGVNSLTTLTNKKKPMQKIKIIEAMDLIKQDIFNMFIDEYVGKVQNDFANKTLLVVAINNYLANLVKQGILNGNNNSVDINLNAIIEYLKENGVDTEDMKEQEIKEANTDSSVFLTGQVEILDAMEDLDLSLLM